MKRLPNAFIGIPEKLARIIVSAALLVGISIPCQLALPTIAYADTTGATSPSITIFYGTGDTVSGQWQENVLTVGGKKAYCVEVDSDFKSGLNVSSCDPVAKGIWSQEICTKLALIDNFVRSGEYVSTSKGTGTGKKVTDPNQQYAVAQCYIWKFLNDAGYAKNHYGWFGASMSSGIDLTGSDTDKQVWDYVSANLSSYIGSAKYYDCGSSQNVACDFSLSPAKGSISLVKKSSDENLTKGNSEYSLRGATYGVYSKKDCDSGSLVSTMTTDASGKAKSDPLENGSYFVKERSASQGFAVDENTYAITVESGKETLVNADTGYVPESPKSGALELRKTSANASISDGNTCYSLKGALYGVYSDQDCSNLIAKMTTNDQGTAKATNLPLGIKYIREISAPQGYATNGTVYSAVVSNEKTTLVNGGFVSETPKSCPIEILLEKYDDQKDPDQEVGIAQGSASLADAEFTVRHYGGFFDSPEEAEESEESSRTWIFKTDDNGQILLDEAHLVSGDVLYLSSDGKPCMPLGTVTIKESAPPAGYIASDEAVSIQITDDGSAEELVETYKQPFVPNRIIRGDLEFVKYSGDEENILSGIPFAITSQTTGETHVVVTDESGHASTASTFTPHSKNTNGNDWMIGQENESEDSQESSTTDSEDAEKEDPEEKSDGVDDSIAQEQESEEEAAPSTSNNVIDEDSDSATSTSEESAETKPNSEESSEGEAQSADSETDSSDSDGAKKSDPDDNESDSTDEEDAEDEPDESKAHDSGVWFGGGENGGSFVSPDDSLGALPFDTYSIRELPCKENEGLQLIEASVVISSDGTVVDLGSIDDPKASIGTIAHDAEDNDNTLAMGESVSIIDSVSYANLIPSKSYDLTGSLVNAETGDPIVDAEGSPIKASMNFVPEEESGSVDLTFGLSTEDLADAKIVVFETLTCDKRTIATHEDIDDTNQTMRVAKPAIGTMATNAEGNSQAISADTHTVVKDVVSYCNLIPGHEYTLESSLMNASTGKPFEVDGQPISSTTSFTPESANGTVTATFEFDALAIEEELNLVAFEKVLNEKGLVASHEDADDKGQTITLFPPSIQTSLSESETANKVIPTDSVIHLNDFVSYVGLTPGREYTLKGTLMDKESGKERTREDGSAIFAETKFTPDASQGEAVVEFEIEGIPLAGKQVVAFETLYSEDREIAIHADLNDESQTIAFSQPSIRTSAADADDQDKVVASEALVKVIDTVSLSGLIPGRDYTVMGIMMDKSTELPLIQGQQEDEQEAPAAVSKKELEEFWKQLIESSGANLNDGAQENLDKLAAQSFDGDAIEKAMAGYPSITPRIVTQSKAITPEDESMDLDMEFTFSSKGIAGQTVVYEALLDNQSGKIVATHADINDENQTVEVVPDSPDYSPSKSRAISKINGSAYDKTGNLLIQYAWIFALIAGIGGTSGLVAMSQRQALRKRQEEIRMASLFGKDQ